MQVMKISSEVGLNSIAYINETKVQNEPQRMGMSIGTDKVTISEEGASQWREHLSQKVGAVYQREECGAVELDSTGTDVWKHELGTHRSNLLREIREKGSEYGFEEIMSASLDAYATLYEKINKGYEDGTREVWVADGKDGKRKLSKEEDIERLNNAYKKEIEWQTMVMNSRKEIERGKKLAFSGVQAEIDTEADKKDSDELTRIMEKMKDEYLSHRKDGDYDRNINTVSNIVSSVLGRFELKNHMINIFEGISLLK